MGANVPFCRKLSLPFRVIKASHTHSQCKQTKPHHPKFYKLTSHLVKNQSMHKRMSKSQMVSDGLLNSLHSFQPAVLGKPLTVIQAISMENVVLEIQVFQEETQGILVANERLSHRQNNNIWKSGISDPILSKRTKWVL